MQHCELGDTLGQVRLRRDRVPSIDGFSLVPGQLHGDRSRDARAFEIPDGGASKIMNEAAVQTGSVARRFPSSDVRFDQATIAVKDMWNDSLQSPFDFFCVLPLRLQQFRERRERGEGKLAALAILGHARLKANDASVEVHVSPP